MAEALAAAITDNLLTCIICHDEYEDPRVLPCYHTFCFGCISNHAKKTLSRKRTFPCPICRDKIHFPREGLENLKTDFRVHTAKDVLSQQHEISSPRQVTDVRGVTQATAQKTISCKKHPNKGLEFYCEDDDTVICGDCVTTDHFRHGIAPVDKNAKRNRDKIKEALEKTMETPDRFKEAVDTETANITEVSHMIDNTIDEIENQAQNIVGLINKMKDTLISKVISDFGQTRKQMEANKDILELHDTSLRSACDFAQELVTKGTDLHIMIYAKSLLERLAEIEKTSVLIPDTPAQISYSHGEVSVVGLEAMLGQVTIQTQPPLDGKETNLRSEPLSPRLIARLGQVSIQSKPSLPAQGTNPSSAPHSPVFLQTVELVHSFQSKLKDDTEINIFGLAMDEVHVVVTDDKNDRTKIFRHSGEFKFDIKLDRPFDVTVSQTGHLYITPRDDGCVKVYSTRGQQVTTMGRGTLEGPRGITLNRQGHVMVCDGRKKSIFTFHADSGRLMNTMSLRMCAYPRYITVNSVNDNIVVSDSNGHCVHVLSTTGDKLYHYGREGSGVGQLDGPCGVCTDSFGYIFIADCNNHRIVALSPRGKFIRYIATKGDGLKYPKALAISPAGLLMVAEADGNVKTFQYLQ